VPRLAIHTASCQSARFNDSPNDLWRYGLIAVLAHGQYSAHSLEDFHLVSFLNQHSIETPTCEIGTIASCYALFLAGDKLLPLILDSSVTNRDVLSTLPG